MNEFRFAQVEWLHALWGIAIFVVGLFILEFRGGKLLDRLISPWMQSRLVRKPPMLRRMFSIALLALTLIFWMIALMRPQWGMTLQSMSRVDSQIMICLDVSKSMLAEDVVPNRLERAKAEIDVLLGLMGSGQQVGLMAFAGKPAVLCPLTTDFGFLRLVLQEATPATVGLGGTRIGDAIRKASDGFRDVGDVNRMILLITDGEDHDSFPMDAAEVAVERGVRIVSIGFGDELGSKIEVTDPTTGVRSFVIDRDGHEVTTRLDGDTLRDIALKTEGAYIPAGTGALDLQSIYETHLQPMIKGTANTEDRIVRNEAYQWCLLMSLFFLIAALAAPIQFFADFSGRVVDGERSQSVGEMRTKPSRTKPLAMIGLVCGSAFFANLTPVIAQDETTTPRSEDASKPLSPRESYNLALTHLRSDPDRAEQLLTSARSKAGVDGELRYRSLYNLGWVEIGRADSLLETEPKQSLQHLEMAASRFREAIRVRSDSADARYNLEIVSRRILELSDTLAKQAPQDNAARLDAIIAEVRSHQSELQSAANRDENLSLVPSEELRTEFRRLSVSERQLISDVEKFIADTRREVTALRQKPDDQVDNEDQLRAAQLDAMLAYIDQATQRFNKARSFIRRLQGERAFVRWADGLTNLKRGRDQLRDPVEVLGVLIEDSEELAGLTKQVVPVPELGEFSSTKVQIPAWLSVEYLSETQQANSERVTELRDLLIAGIRQHANSQEETQPDEQTDPGADDRTSSAVASQAAQLVANAKRALPSLDTAADAFRASVASLEASEFQQSWQSQLSGMDALLTAAEFFFDLRRLIEVTAQSQRGLEQIVSQLALDDSLPMAAMGVQLQQKNLERMSRLTSMFDDEVARLESAAADAGPLQIEDGVAVDDAESRPEQTAQEQTQLELERYQTARQLATQAISSMQRVAAGLEGYPDLIKASSEAQSERPPQPQLPRPPSPTRMHTTPDGQLKFLTPEIASGPTLSAEMLPMVEAEAAVHSMEELRRLFFSIVEHLRDTAERQLELNDNTAEVLGSSSSLAVDELGPLQSRQASLSQIAQQISAELSKQGATAQESAVEAGGEPASGPPSAEQAAALIKAAELVGQGEQAMSTAAQLMDSLASSQLPTSAVAPETNVNSTDQASALIKNGSDQDNESSRITAQQMTALEKLIEALAQLDEQESGESDQNQDQNSDNPENSEQPADSSDQEQQSASAEDNEREEQSQQRMSAAQMLQAIRDREAQRREEKNARQAVGSATVEKDW